MISAVLISFGPSEVQTLSQNHVKMFVVDNFSVIVVYERWKKQQHTFCPKTTEKLKLQRAGSKRGSFLAVGQGERQLAHQFCLSFSAFPSDRLRLSKVELGCRDKSEE